MVDNMPIQVYPKTKFKYSNLKILPTVNLYNIDYLIRVMACIDLALSYGCYKIRSSTGVAPIKNIILT